MAFKIAGSQTAKDGAAQGRPRLLEPMMEVEVTTADDFLGDVMGDLNSRRGQVEGMEPRGNAQVVRAKVPLAEMFGYATDLRSMTQGRATYSMQFCHYSDSPDADIANGLIAQVQELSDAISGSRTRGATQWPRRSSSATSPT